MEETNKLIDFIFKAINPKLLNKDNIIWQSLLPLIFSFLALFGGFTSTTNVRCVTIVGTVVSAMISVSGLVVSLLQNKVKKYFAVATLFAINMELSILLIQIALVGLSFGLILFVIFPMLTVLFAYDYYMKKASLSIKRKINFPTKTVLGGSAIFAVSRLVSDLTSHYLDDAEQRIFVTFITLMLNCVISIILVNIPRLYYVIKLEKQGIDLSEYDTFVNCQK